MNYGNESLIKISDDIFQESDPPQDRKKPLEWRRSFNFVKLTLKNLKLINSFNVHEKEFSLDHGLHGSINQIKSNIKTTLAITGELDEERFRDSIYIAVENKDEKDLFSTERTKGPTEITLKSGPPTESEDNGIPDGLYWGNVFRMNFDPGEDNLVFELTLPLDKMQQIITELKEDQNTSIEIGALLLSFTFEVDDFLREHYHPRDMIINDSTLCFLSWITLSSKHGQHYIKFNPEDETALETDLDSSEYQELLTVEQINKRDQLKVFGSYIKPINNLTKALWFLILVIAIQILFK